MDYEIYRHSLWALCYRMTGSAADAEDLVQETFLRAVEKPPANAERCLGPWLHRIALNLARDSLRHRQSRAYVGPWLPSPVPTDALIDARDSEPRTPAARYAVMESVSFAFLLALEVLSPTQRAVLLLRDVFDWSTAETAAALDESEANVKTTLHRARKAMVPYDEAARRAPPRDLNARTREVLHRVLQALAHEDHAGLAVLLAEECAAYSDGGGEFFAARKPLQGRERVLRFYSSIAAQRSMASRVELIELNRMPALVYHWRPAETRAGHPTRAALLLDIEAGGLVRRVYSVLATSKLTALSTASGQ